MLAEGHRIFQVKQVCGATGKVFEIVDQFGEKKALKTLNFLKFNRAQLNELKQEINFLRRLDHPNIVRIFEVYKSEDSIRVIMDLCEGGDLRSSFRRLYANETKISIIAYQLFLSLKYLHDRNIVHRDVKLENIMLVSNNRDNMSIRLIDFGFATEMKFSNFPWIFKKSKTNLKSYCGSPLAMAPECFLGSYDEKCDIWSAGIVIYVLITGKYPFDVDPKKLIQYQVVEETFSNVDFSHPNFEKCPKLMRILQNNIFLTNPKNRCSAGQILNCDWFHNVIRHKLEKPISTQVIDKGNDDTDTENFESKLIQSFQTFQVLEESNKLLSLVLARFLPINEVTRFHQVFLSINRDHSGLINFNEFKDFLKSHGIGDKIVVQKLFRALDVDGSGKIQLTEFIAASIPACEIKLKVTVLSNVLRLLYAQQDYYIETEPQTSKEIYSDQDIFFFNLTTLIPVGKRKDLKNRNTILILLEELQTLCRKNLEGPDLAADKLVCED